LDTHVQRLKQDQNGMDLLKALLVYSPSCRLDADKAINHPFFKDFDKSGLPVFNPALA